MNNKIDFQKVYPLVINGENLCWWTMGVGHFQETLFIHVLPRFNESYVIDQLKKLKNIKPRYEAYLNLSRIEKNRLNKLHCLPTKNKP